MTETNPRSDDVFPSLRRILDLLEQLLKKLDQVLEAQTKAVPAEERKAVPARREELAGLKAMDVSTLLSMPDHLRKAAMIVMEKGRATAAEVSQETGRARAVESSYLNQLVSMGHLKKERKRRTVYFYISD